MQQNCRGISMYQEWMCEFREKLLKWYDKNARVLPWRDNPSPYRVWVSEIMLQQTRVDTVKPYFERFMNAVPRMEDLANISDEQLLKLWEGLGYYSRARNLKKAAGIIIEKFSGHMPKDREGLESLPGIGPYTAGAVASIAFGESTPAVDGNVLRVIARVTANSVDIASPAVKKEIESLVTDMLPKERTGDFNQALMELGATICLPSGAPRCMECPVYPLCQAHQQGIVGELPVKAKKKERKIEKKTIFVINYNGRIAIRQRPEEGLLSGLWEFPSAEGHLSGEQSGKTLKGWGIATDEVTSISSAKHIFTHLEWHMKGYYVTVGSVQENTEFIWATWTEIKEKYTIPTAFKAYMKFIEEQAY